MKKGLLLLLLISMAFAVSCQKKSTAAEEWEIPFLNCLTGPIASIGEYLQWGAE
ncbi:MAG: ABC transporter substrate-binding protein, partial [Spirochaetales bacterium]